MLGIKVANINNNNFIHNANHKVDIKSNKLQQQKKETKIITIKLSHLYPYDINSYFYDVLEEELRIIKQAICDDLYSDYQTTKLKPKDIEIEKIRQDLVKGSITFKVKDLKAKFVDKKGKDISNEIYKKIFIFEGFKKTNIPEFKKQTKDVLTLKNVNRESVYYGERDFVDWVIKNWQYFFVKDPKPYFETMFLRTDNEIHDFAEGAIYFDLIISLKGWLKDEVLAQQRFCMKGFKKKIMTSIINCDAIELLNKPNELQELKPESDNELTKQLKETISWRVFDTTSKVEPKDIEFTKIEHTETPGIIKLHFAINNSKFISNGKIKERYEYKNRIQCISLDSYNTKWILNEIKYGEPLYASIFGKYNDGTVKSWTANKQGYLNTLKRCISDQQHIFFNEFNPSRRGLDPEISIKESKIHLKPKGYKNPIVEVEVVYNGYIKNEFKKGLHHTIKIHLSNKGKETHKKDEAKSVKIAEIPNHPKLFAEIPVNVIDDVNDSGKKNQLVYIIVGVCSAVAFITIAAAVSFFIIKKLKK